MKQVKLTPSVLEIDLSEAQTRICRFIKEYVENAGAKGIVLGLSGGVDSVDAQGSDQRVEQEGAIRQGSDRDRDAGRILITAGTGAALGAVVDRTVQGAAIGAGAGGAVGLATVMLTRGRDVELRQGATIDVVLDRPLIVE